MVIKNTTLTAEEKKNPPQNKTYLQVRLATQARKLRETKARVLKEGNHLAEADVFAARIDGEIGGLEWVYALLEEMGDFVVEKPIKLPRKRKK